MSLSLVIMLVATPIGAQDAPFAMLPTLQMQTENADSLLRQNQTTSQRAPRYDARQQQRFTICRQLNRQYRKSVDCHRFALSNR